MHNGIWWQCSVTSIDRSTYLPKANRPALPGCKPESFWNKWKWVIARRGRKRKFEWLYSVDALNLWCFIIFSPVSLVHFLRQHDCWNLDSVLQSHGERWYSIYSVFDDLRISNFTSFGGQGACRNFCVPGVEAYLSTGWRIHSGLGSIDHLQLSKKSF